MGRWEGNHVHRTESQYFLNNPSVAIAFLWDIAGKKKYKKVKKIIVYNGIGIKKSFILFCG